MASTRVDYNSMGWSSAVPFYGPAAVQDGRELIQLKILSDRRADGGGIATSASGTFDAPPPTKLA